MGKKTHGPYLLQAIEHNSHEKVHEICAKQIGNKEKVRELCVSNIKRLASEHTEIPLLLAAQLPDPSILTYLIHKHGVDINHIFKEQLGRRIKIKTALIMGVRRGLYDTVEVMLSSNADPNAQDHKGRTPLHHAVRKADFRMAKMLLSRGAQASLFDKGENTPLHVASIFGHVELCKMLIHYGGDLYKKGQLGAIPIHIAAKEGHVALLKMFCQHDVNPNIKMPCYDGREKAALHVAAEEGHHECVSCLIDLGGDPNLGDSEGETPITCCVLREHDPMGMKSKEDYTEAVKCLLRNGAEVNLQNGRGESALHLAARNEFHKIVELLLQAGIDPLIEDNSGDKAIDLVNDEDAVTRQIIKQAMENRERYLNDVFEMKAKGYSTSLDVLTTGRSTSTLSIQDSDSRLGRATSTPGLGMLGMPPHQMTYEGYLQPLRNGDTRLTAAQVHNRSRSHSSSSPHETASQISSQMNRSIEQTYARIDPDETFEEPRESQQEVQSNDKSKKFGLPNFLKKRSQESLLQRKASQLSSDSSPYDTTVTSLATNRSQERPTETAPKKPAIMPIEQGTRKLPSPPPSSIRDSMLSSDVSGIWDTPRSSTSTFRADGDFGVGRKTDELMQKLQQNIAAKKFEYSDINTTQYESLPGVAPSLKPKGRSTPTPVRSAASPKVHKQLQIVAQEQNGLSDSDDTFFDDESFDSVSEATVEMVQQNQQKIELANKELFNDSKKPKDPHVQHWVSEQATIAQQRTYKNTGPLAHSSPPSSKTVSNTPFSDTDDQFTSVSQQVGKPKGPAMARLDKNANSKPMPPPRPPKNERNVSVSSIDSFKREPPAVPHSKSKSKPTKPSVSSIETESNVVHLEVDEKEPGQTVIRIMPANKKQPPSPKPKHPRQESVSTFTPHAPVDNKSKDTTGRHGSQGYRAGVLDTDSEIMSEISTSSFFRPVPKKRNKIVARTESRKEPSPNKRFMRAMENDDDINSDFSSDSDEENIDTGHMNARFFVGPSLNTQAPELRKSQDLFEKDQPTPLSPTTPTIKMTMKMPELSTNRHDNLPSINANKSHSKVLPEPPPKLKTKEKVLPEPPPKAPVRAVQPKPEPPVKVKPETPVKPEMKPSPQVPKKPVLPKREDKPKPATPVKPPVQKVIQIEHAPKPIPKIAQLAQEEDTMSTGSFSDATEEEPLPPAPQTKPPSAPKPASRKHTNPSEEKASSPVTVESKPEESKAEETEKTTTTEKPKKKKKSDETKTKKKKKKVKASKETTPEKPLVENAEHSADTIPTEMAPSPVSQAKQQESSMTATPTQQEDDTYMQPVSRPTIPIEANPTPKSEPAVLSARQKRKQKRLQSKSNPLEDEEETEEMKPVEQAVYQNSPPPRPKVKHSTANKDGVPYAMVDRTRKTSAEEKGAPVFVKVERSISSLSEDSNKAPPLPAPLESPYAEISVVDEIIKGASGSDSSKSQEALDLEHSKRRVTIGNKEFIPNNTKRPKDHDHRRVVYTCGQQVDFEIIGGNADGVFVHNVRPGSGAENAGLMNGDKILRINGRSTTGKTREDITAQVNSIKRLMDLVVRERRDVYKTILEHDGIGDAFCVRAHFNYKPTQQGELAIKPGDIFSVKDTLPNNTFGYWRAVKLNAGPRDQQNGYIYNMRRAEQYSIDQRMSQLKAFERQKGGFMKKGFNRSKSLDRLKKGKSQEDLSLDTRNTIAYEKVEQRKAPFPKPVLLLGLFCDQVRDLLAKELPKLFAVPKEQVETPQDPNAKNNKEPVRLDLIKDICYSQNKHCLTILSPAGIEYLQKTDLNPIVIYLAPGSKAIVKIVKNKFAPNFDRKPSFLYEEAMAFEKQQSHLFTAAVPYTDNDAWFENLKEMIQLLQDQSQWYVLKEPEEDDDEDYEEPTLPGSPTNPNMPSQLPPPHTGRLNRSMEHIPDSIENVLNLHAGRQPEQRMRAQSSGAMLGDPESMGSLRGPPKSILKNKGYSSNNSDSGSASSTGMGTSGKPPSGRAHLPPRPPQHSMLNALEGAGHPPPQQGYRHPPPHQTQQGYRGPPPQGYHPSHQPYNQPPHGYHQPPNQGYQPPHQGHQPPNQGYQPPPHQGYQPPLQAPFQNYQQPSHQPPHQPANQGYHQQQPQHPPAQPAPQSMAGFHPAFQQLGPMAPTKSMNAPHNTSQGKETSF